jgi:ribose/xylose/arabinose/galactoside ABC-type transport system permease subunit
MKLGPLAFSGRHRNEWGLATATLLVVLVTMALDGGRSSSYFVFPQASLQDIFRQTSLLGIFALGSAVVIIAGGIDLSSGAVIAFAGTFCAMLMMLMVPESMRNETALLDAPIYVITAAVLLTLLAGLAIGSLHAWLITRVGLPPFVATLATLVGLRSLARAMILRTMGGTQISVNAEGFRALGNSVPLITVLFLTLAAGVWLLMSKTVTGRRLYALGGNEQAAHLCGLRTDRLKWFAYCLSAVLSSLAGILYVGQQAVAEPHSLGYGYELNAIAGAVVGGCSLQGGAGTIPGAVLGVLFLRVVIDGVAKVINADSEVYEGLIVGAVVVLAVAYNQFRGRKLRT